MRLAASRQVTVAARGPGELAGSAVAVTLEVVNGEQARVSLEDAVVTAAAGTEETSPSDAPPARPLGGTLRPGARTTGVYVFVLPGARRVPLRVTVSLSPSRPVAVLVTR